MTCRVSSSRVSCVLLCATLVALVGSTAAVDYSRVWLVDHAPGGNYLFRGNMPVTKVNGTYEFAYNELIGYMRQRASSEGITLPEDLYMVDVSLCNFLDGGYSAEENFWKDPANKDKGEIVNWPLGLAGIFPPCIYPEDKRYSMANSSVWKVDKIPSRIEILHNMLTQKFPKTAVIYVHCSAGCDRTGEVIGSYILWYQTMNLTSMYNQDTHECGRSPNYYSTSALEWFCYYVADQRGHDSIGNCCGFATCKPFGSCEPTGKSLEGEPEAQSGGPPPSAVHHRITMAAAQGALTLTPMEAQDEELRYATMRDAAARTALGVEVDDNE